MRADQPAPAHRPSPARIVLVGLALAAAALGAGTGRSLDYTDISGPLTQVERDPMTTYAPAGAELKSEVRSRRGPNGAPRIDPAGTMYEREPMVLRSFLLTGDAGVAADKAAATARTAGWAITETDDPYIPPGTQLESSVTQPKWITRDLFVPKPGSTQAVLSAADATADAARQAGWKLEPFSTRHTWFGTKRIGGRETTLRIDVDLLEGASGTYVDDKTGIVKVSVLVRD